MSRESSARSRKRPLVFVIEDDDTTAGAICALLNDAGYAARRGTTLQEASAYLTAILPDCVLLDWSLPDGDAEHILAEITTRAQVPPTVLLSAHPAARAVAARYGVALIEKPYDPDVLVAAIETALQCGMRPRARTA